MARHKELDDEKVLQDIYNAAVELIETDGLDKLSIRKICKMANISTGTFYHYYPTKTELINRLIDHMENYYKNDVVPYLSGTGIEKLRTLVIAHVKRVIRRGLGYAQWNADYRTYCGLTPADYDSFYKSRLFLQTAQEAVDNGETNGEYTAHEICTMLYGICYGSMMLYTTLSGQIDIIAHTEMALNAFMDGIKR